MAADQFSDVAGFTSCNLSQSEGHITSKVTVLLVTGIINLDSGDEFSVKLTCYFKAIDGLLNKVCNVLLHGGVLASKKV